MSSDHTIRTEVRLSGSIPATFIMGKDLDGIYIGGDFQGEADGFYIENVATAVPDGLWSGGINTGLPADGLWLGGVFAGVVDGYYVANVRTTLADGLWVGEQYQGAVDGWYEDNTRETLQDGLWVGEVYQGIADGYYVGNVAATVPDGYWSGGVLGPVPDGYWSGGVLGPVPDGVWDGGVDTGLAQGWYEANKPALVPSGIWNGGVNEGLANGYFSANHPAPIPDGCYRNGGLVDPYYEAIIKAAEALGGGLYLFQLKHGKYAGEQVIWQEMGEINPWTPGLLTPQGKTYDLMGSGEYLGQSVSMRRPVDGVFDGVSTFLQASSDAVGGHLHKKTPHGIFVNVKFNAPRNTQACLLATTNREFGETGFLMYQPSSGLNYLVPSDRTIVYQHASGVIVPPGAWESLGHVTTTAFNSRIFRGGAEIGTTQSITALPTGAAYGNLTVGAGAAGSGFMSASIEYIAIYTREPTAYEISLHKRTP